MVMNISKDYTKVSFSGAIGTPSVYPFSITVIQNSKSDLEFSKLMEKYSTIQV